MSPITLPNIIFITGTDTGVGKTVLTGLLLRHLRQRGCLALAMKPFCSGGLQDVELLARAQDHALSAAEINPFYFPEPVAPLVSARKHRRQVALEDVVAKVQGLAPRCEILLVEGAGGLFVPLGEGFTIADLIARLRCETIVVAANRLGTINHTLLTVAALRQAKTPHVQCVLMASAARDASTADNGPLLAELLGPTPLIPLAFLGRNPLGKRLLETNVKKSQKSIACLCASSKVCALFFASRKRRGKKDEKKLKKLLTIAAK